MDVSLETAARGCSPARQSSVHDRSDMKSSARLVVHAAALALLCCGILSAQQLPLLTRALDIRELSVQQAELGYPVKLTAIVTFCDTDARTVFAQDQSAGVSMELAQPDRSLIPGQLVQVTGVTKGGSFLPVIAQARATVLGARKLPAASPTSLSRARLEEHDSRRIRFEGIVQTSYQEGRYTVLEAYEGARRIQIRMQGFSHASAPALVDSRIAVEGVLGITADSAHRAIGLVLWAPQGTRVAVLSGPPTDPDRLPVTPIARLEEGWKTGPPQHRIRIRGRVLPGDAESSLLVQDATGTIQAFPLFSRPISPGDEVDLIGFADLGSRRPAIVNATYLRVKALAIQSNREKNLPTLALIGAIRRLAAAEALRGYPVRITGVLTYHRPELAMTFIQEGSEAIYLQSFDPKLALDEGARYQVTGFTAPGDFAPIVVDPVFRLLGPGSMPEAQPITLDELAGGDYDCRRVRVRGVVRAARQVDARWRLELFAQGRTIEVWVPSLSSPASFLSLEDAEIIVEGICSIQISPWGAISGFRINAASLKDIEVEKSAAASPFSAPLRSIRDVFRSSNGPQGTHRIRIQGTLLHQQPGKVLYLKDDTGTISVSTDHILPVNPGDLLSVSGYPAPGEFSPRLDHALVRRLGSGAPPHSHGLREGGALNDGFHGDLVRVKAVLIDQWHNADGRGYLLQAGGDSRTSFEAFLQDGHGGAEPVVIRNGSQLELSGIYLLRTRPDGKYAFQLLLRTPEDIRVLKSAPWWTGRHLYWAFIILIGLILSAVLWVALLRRRVRRQTATIQQRLAAEAALEKKYRELFERSNDVVFTCSETGNIISINPAGERILGYDAQELSVLPPDRLATVAALPRIAEWIENKVRGLEVPPLECALASKDGHIVQLEVEAEIILSDGRPIGAQGIARDITERKHAEEALRQSDEKMRQVQKLEAIGRLAGGIAHDFNNILSAIMGYAELSLEGMPADHPIRSYLEQIAKAGRRARDLVQQILAFSRKLDQERRPIQLEGIIDEALKLLRATLPATIELSSRIHPECGLVMADPTQMHQVIVNLATNASHAIGQSAGAITVELEKVSLKTKLSVAFPEVLPGDYLRLSVADTGPGIAPEVQKRIFEPYFTTKEVGQGSGLGLAVVHGIVESHGGGIMVLTAPERGACFQVYLPCCEAEAVPASPAVAEVVRGRGRILLVDDEEAIVNLATRALERLGYQVTGETESASALERFRRNPDDIDLVITDQTMPRMTGLSLAQEIWKIRPGFPIVISSGFSEQITADKAPSHGFRAFLSKPYTTAELARTVQQSLASAPVLS